MRTHLFSLVLGAGILAGAGCPLLSPQIDNSNTPGNTNASANDNVNQNGSSADNNNAANDSGSPGDTDDDGLSDDLEATLGTDPNKPDTDGDGLSDNTEVEAGTNPLTVDTDGDTLTDGDEIAHGTNPQSADTDDDGLNDAQERAAGTNPNDWDTDGDAYEGQFGPYFLRGGDGDEVLTYGTNPLVADSDGDGLQDGYEFYYGTSALDTDSDDDGMSDGDEVGLSLDPLSPTVIGTFVEAITGGVVKIQGISDRDFYFAGGLGFCGADDDLRNWTAGQRVALGACHPYRHPTQCVLTNIDLAERFDRDCDVAKNEERSRGAIESINLGDSSFVAAGVTYEFLPTGDERGQLASWQVGDEIVVIAQPDADNIIVVHRRTESVLMQLSER